MAAPLGFDELSRTNLLRARRWHPGFPDRKDGWSLADWSNAMCGEAGEAANVVKKIRRLEEGLRGRASESDLDDLLVKLGHEIADVVIYADLLATRAGIDLASAIREKFNLTSAEHGFPEFL